MEQLIVRKLEDWESFFKGLSDLRTQSQDVVRKTIIAIKALKDKKLVSLGYEMFLINLLVKLKINNFDEALKLLESLSEFYNYTQVLEEINSLKAQYGVTDIGFILDNNVVIEEYYSFDKFRKVYLVNECIPERYYDFKTNGIARVVIKGLKPFIIEQRDLKKRNNSFNKRIICTKDFRLKTELLPKKEEMDIIRIKEERKNIFNNLIYFLSTQVANVTLITCEPEGDYLQNMDMGRDYFTISSDGIMSDGVHELEPQNSLYLTSSEIKVKDANFVVISEVKDNLVKHIYLVVKPAFLEEIENNSNEYIKGILKTFKREKLNVKTLMLKS